MEELELADGKIGGSSSLHTFSTGDSNTDMSLTDHGTVIGTITNSKSDFAFVSHSHQCDYITLLLGRDSASNNDLHIIGTLKHEFHKTLMSVDNVKTLTRENQSVSLSWLLVI